MSALLLIGFNRPEFTIKQVNKLIHHPKLFDEIYLYIDGARENNESDLLNQSKIRNFLKDTSKEGSINFHFSQHNLGLTQHIVTAISTVLEKHSSVVVLEDDVEFEINSLRSINSQLDKITKENMLNPVIGMSGLSKQKYLSLALHNKWRTSKYFCAWGYGINREFWKMHLNFHYEKKKTSSAELNSKDKPKRKMRIWEERFSRKIYDYEIQESMSKCQIRAFAPRFRIVGNLGHGPNSTHTKFTTPRYLRRPLDNRLLAPRIDFKTLHTVERVILDFMDSRTFGGDSIFSVRGRTFGIRSLFRSLFKSTAR